VTVPITLAMNELYLGRRNFIGRGDFDLFAELAVIVLFATKFEAEK